MCCYDTEFEFENDFVNIECVKANDDPAIFNYDVCDRHL